MERRIQVIEETEEQNGFRKRRSTVDINVTELSNMP
jgi:hypothetical protein